LVLLTKYFSSDEIKKSEFGETNSTCEVEENCIQVLVWQSEGKRLLGKPRHRSESMNLEEIEFVAWSGLVWLRIRTSGGLL